MGPNEMRENALRIAWGITGSGCYIRECFEVFHRVKMKYPVKITTFLSRAGEEVARMYGLADKLGEISPGGYYEEIVTEDSTGWSCTYSGRFMLRRYDALLVAPATSNTVAKIVCGIADTIITTIVSQALKGGMPVFILPSDAVDETTIPCYINRDICIQCMDCVGRCPYGAILELDGLPYIDLLRCHGCRECETFCPVNAISCFQRAKIVIRDLDRENIEKLRRIEGIKVIEHPESIEETVRELLEGGGT